MNLNSVVNPFHFPRRATNTRDNVRVYWRVIPRSLPPHTYFDVVFFIACHARFQKLFCKETGRIKRKFQNTHAMTSKQVSGACLADRRATCFIPHVFLEMLLWRAPPAWDF